jgi:hypothetical protein
LLVVGKENARLAAAPTKIKVELPLTLLYPSFSTIGSSSATTAASELLSIVLTKWYLPPLLSKFY